MKKDYDFSEGVRGKFYRPNKIQKTLRLDADILAHFQNLATKRHVGYQTLINSALRESIVRPSEQVDIKTLRRELHSAIHGAPARD